MSHNYLSAFARVTEGGDSTSATQTAASVMPQTYHQLAAFGMQPMSATGMFPSAAVNATPAHSHQQSAGQQSPMGQAQWVQNMSQRQQVSESQARSLQQMMPPGNIAMPGTPLLEWNGREWIPPQQSSIAAVAAQQVSLPNAVTQTLPGTYSTLSQLAAWNPQAHLDTHSQANHTANQVQHATGQGASASNSFNSTEGSHAPSQPIKQPRKRTPKAKNRQAPPSQLQNQHHLVQNLSLARSNSSEDLLSAEQIARVSGSTTSKEEVARDSLLSLAQTQQADLVQHQSIQRLQQPQSQHEQPIQAQPVLAELTVVRQKVIEPPVIEPEPEVPPRPVRPFDGRYAVCLNCGTMSENYNNCEYCKKELPDDCKMYDPAKAKADEEQRRIERQKKADNERLLLAKLRQEKMKKVEQAKRTMGIRVQVDRLTEQKRGRPAKGSVGAATEVSPTGKSFYGRKVAVKDYSDTDPVWTPSRAKSRGGGKATATTSKRGRKAKQAEVFVISSSEDDDSDEYIPPPTSRSTTSRKGAGAAPSHASKAPRGRANSSSMIRLRPDLTQVPELYMKCTKITMGSLQGHPKEPLHIAISGVDINLETETESVKIRLDNRDVRECLGCTHEKLPILFFRANESFGKKVRTALKMIDPEQDPYYDPDSNDAKHKYIVGYLDDKAQISNLGWRLQEVFRAISLQYQTGGVLLRFIELDKAQMILAKITGEGGQSSTFSVLDSLALSYDASDEAEDQEQRPQLFFEGPIKKMFQYPFPPAIGAITVTNEDYFCLHDGEFLNDIVISFYLKYLTEKVLSDVDRERTFVFSSFFYTRLTQPFTGLAAKDFKKTAAEKRHTRVKTWTKNVDLFSKDFIIIPINEHSHWYLAIICFPHLDGVVYGDAHTPPAEFATGEGTKSESDNVVSSTTLEENTPTGDDLKEASEKNDRIESSSSNSPSPIKSLDRSAADASLSSSSAVLESASSDCIEEVAPPTTDDSAQNQQGKSETEASESDAKHSTNAAQSTGNGSESESLPIDLFGFDDSDDDDISKGEPATANRMAVKRPCILIFDSLAGPGHGPVIRALRDYLTVEWKVRKGTDRSFGREKMRGANVKCPQQNNYSDCGVYLLQYVESFFETPISDWSIPMKCTKDWFDYSVIKNKRPGIQSLMSTYEEQFSARPVAGRGRPRTTRKTVAAAHANSESMKKSTTLSTTVPEALGLAQTPQAAGVSPAKVSIADISSSPELSAAAALSQSLVEDSDETQDTAPVKKSKIDDEGAISPQHPSPNSVQSGDTRQPVTSSPTPTDNHNSLHIPNNRTLDEVTNQTPGADHTPTDDRNDEGMEVKEESSSLELFSMSRSGATDEEMDHTSSAREHAEKGVEEMQTESSMKPVINNDYDETEMQTDVV